MMAKIMIQTRFLATALDGQKKKKIFSSIIISIQFHIIKRVFSTFMFWRAKLLWFTVQMVDCWGHLTKKTRWKTLNFAKI